VAGGLFNLDKDKLWSNPAQRQSTLEDLYKQLEIPGTGPGMGQQFYDLKNTFSEDAMTCWKGFGRTTDPGHCDYRKENKRIRPDTADDRREAGMDPQDRPNIFLCDFCPLQSIVQQKIRADKGLYA
jgi:hypothetical protein